jgi:outer membrane protein OmpA-like peptidoglycan-associated protein
LLVLIFVILGEVCFKNKIFAQSFESVKIISVLSGSGTNNALFKATSSTIPSLAYIKAQKIGGPQNGFFTQQGDDIRYTAISSTSGIPGNLSRIRFTFLKSDKKTPIEGNNFRFIINDIDGPDNEALATNCDANLRFLGTANPTNLIVANLPPNIIAVGSLEENDGPTSRVMFEFSNVSVIELDNYANDGYLKDFDMNNDYPISTPLYVRCKTVSSSLYTQNSAEIEKQPIEFEKNNDLVLIKTNTIYFDLDKSEIRADAQKELETVLDILNKYPEIQISIQSHTDSRAQDEYNIKLSNERAKASENWLIEKGINSARISTKGFGETKLVNKCSNGIDCTEEEHQMNRRTEFVVINPEVIKKEE